MQTFGPRIGKFHGVTLSVGPENCDFTFAELQTAIDSIKNTTGGVIAIHPDSSPYEIDDPIVIDGSEAVSLVGVGNGNILINESSTFSGGFMLDIFGSDYGVIEDIEFQLKYAAGNSGIKIGATSSYWTVRNCFSAGTLTYLMAEPLRIESAWNLIIGSYLGESQTGVGKGIRILQGANRLIGNIFGSGEIRIESSSATNNIISNNSCSSTLSLLLIDSLYNVISSNTCGFGVGGMAITESGTANYNIVNGNVTVTVTIVGANSLNVNNL